MVSPMIRHDHDQDAAQIQQTISHPRRNAPQYQAPRAKPYHRPDPVFQAIGLAMKAISGAVFHANRASERAIRVYVHPIINMTICRGFRSQQIVRRGPLTKPLQASLSNRSCRALSEDACTFVVVICITSIQHRRD